MILHHVSGKHRLRHFYRQGTSSRTMSSAGASMSALFNPTETHGQLRSMLRDFVRNEVEPQANAFNRKETLNLPLLRQLGGSLGLFGLTVDEKYGGSGLDACSVVLAHEELSYSDPGLCLSYLAHSLLLVSCTLPPGTDSMLNIVKNTEPFLLLS